MLFAIELYFLRHDLLSGKLIYLIVLLHAQVMTPAQTHPVVEPSLWLMGKPTPFTVILQ